MDIEKVVVICITIAVLAFTGMLFVASLSTTAADLAKTEALYEALKCGCGR